MQSPKILIADDERSILWSTKLLLEGLGYRVATVSDARDILGAVEAEAPDLLLQDVRMPGLDLDALLPILRRTRHGAGLPIVIFTAGMDASEVVERVSASGYIEKPFQPHELVTLIDQTIRVRA
ncbi:MAG TPA: response regulator [Candidatus Thermoplasmatota archaeon]|nr:response regulator [Candidatus Thermoplasmatota archaeon]